jgi:hypothetical protein
MVFWPPLTAVGARAEQHGCNGRVWHRNLDIGGVRQELATQAVYPLTRYIGCSHRAVVSASPQTGIPLRDISAELAQRGIMNERGKPFSAADARKVAMVTFVSQKSLT